LRSGKSSSKNNNRSSSERGVGSVLPWGSDALLKRGQRHCSIGLQPFRGALFGARCPAVRNHRPVSTAPVFWCTVWLMLRVRCLSLLSLAIFETDVVGGVVLARDGSISSSTKLKKERDHDRGRLLARAQAANTRTSSCRKRLAHVTWHCRSSSSFADTPPSSQTTTRAALVISASTFHRSTV
jgi:hypothetical protein